MKKVICQDYNELSIEAAKLIAEQIWYKPDSVLGLSTGATPLGLYKELIKMYESDEIDFSQVTTFNLDEYYRISPENPQSYRYYMMENLIKHINIKPENFNIPNGNTDFVAAECERYDELMDRAGGIDLQILGLGVNGHIGFNEPASELDTKTHLTGLKQETIDANARFFNDVKDVPTHAITVGMSSILKSKKVVILISGKNKSKIVKEILKGEITTSVPATLLHLHSDATLLVEKGVV
ncbi:MAG: glucosamine-6-phosphate deaminase [Peptostreptococcaceae bacterium]|nr:glucosamine-6-phosphate deaminase [Peptostreptococcaceae bacterium]